MEPDPQATVCPNCGEPRPGLYCPACGQRQGQRIASLRRILLDALDDQFSINSALPRTLLALLARPGVLTVEYFRGRIQRYIPPFRLYLATSIVFFLVLSLRSATQDTGIVQISGEAEAAGDSLQAERAFVAVPEFEGGLGIRFDDDASPDTTFIRINLGHERLNARAAARIQQLTGLPGEEIAREIGSGVLERAPAGMFILLPVFAALLELLYLRSRRYYVEHFVFALHTHAFTFLWFTLLTPLNDTVPGALGFLWVLLYYFLAMRRFYGQGALLTLAKYAILLVSYSVLLAVTMLGVIAAALLLG